MPMLFVGLHSRMAMEVNDFNFRVMGLQWINRTCESLLFAGIPAELVHPYISYVLENLILWCCLTAIAFIVGMVRSRRAHGAFVVFVISFPICQALYIVWFMAPFNPVTEILREFLLSLGAVPLMGLSWLCGWNIRGRRYQDAWQLPRSLRMGLYIVGVIVALWLSAEGWQIVRYPRPRAAKGTGSLQAWREKSCHGGGQGGHPARLKETGQFAEDRGRSLPFCACLRG